MAVQQQTIDHYNWFKIASANEKIDSLALDPTCVWKWTYSDSDIAGTEEGEGIEHQSFTPFLNWTPKRDLYFRKVRRDFMDLKDLPSWYRMDKG